MVIDRKKILYCNATGRNPGIFRKSEFNTVLELSEE